MAATFFILTISHGEMLATKKGNAICLTKSALAGGKLTLYPAVFIL